jgi:sigma-54 dependent transcriptional regulator, acetoin dehydrogenase operon transcriptional activator AcoR
VCATHRPLRAASDAGAFRDDLFYRINGLMLRLPPLRERIDLLALATRMLREVNPAGSVELADEVLEKMLRYHWPGNLRQLSSVLRTASAMLANHERCIDWAHLPDDMAEDLLATTAPETNRAENQNTKPASNAAVNRAPDNLEQHARLLVKQVLQAHGGNVSQAARALGISRQTLYKKLKQP